MSIILKEMLKISFLDQAPMLEIKGRLWGENKSVVNLDEIIVDKDVLKLIDHKAAVHYGVLPVRKDAGALVVAMSDPGNILVIDELHFMTDLVIRPVFCEQRQIFAYIQKYYQTEGNLHDVLKDTMGGAPVHLAHQEVLKVEDQMDADKFNEGKSAFVNFVDKIISDAVEARASDIHIEPQGKNVEVRYRIDGYLKSIIRVPQDLQKRLAARIKLLASLDIVEQRSAQDGRIKISVAGRKIDLRISVIPVFHGEKIVLRILDSQAGQYDLKRLGLQPGQFETFRDAIHKPQGVVLVTGPTGSGKTTTLYSALQHIKCERKNIVTIEDPIEYLMDGINQLQLNRYKDVTFATSLKSILRQDPDVILVGEIRDRETAEIASRASLTGHLVFSTLHTNSAVASITRLVDIGIEPHLIASSTSLFVAQRLIRLICPNCCEHESPDELLMAKFRTYLDDAPVGRFYRGKGCDQCNHTGFYGRTSIFEILKVDEAIKDLIYQKASESVILREAVGNGMRTLAQSGVLKAVTGLTTLEEVARVVDIADEKDKLFSL